MVSMSYSQCGGEVSNLLFNYFEGSKGGRNGRFYGQMWGKTVRMRVLCEIPMRLPLNNGTIETVIHRGRYLVHARLDYWIMSHNCRNTFPRHELLN